MKPTPKLFYVTKLLLVLFCTNLLQKLSAQGKQKMSISYLIMDSLSQKGLEDVSIYVYNKAEKNI